MIIRRFATQMDARTATRITCCVVATIAVCRPAQALLEAVSPFHPDSTLQATDSTPPRQPFLYTTGVERGRGDISKGKYVMAVEHSETGSIGLIASYPREVPNEKFGYVFHYVDGRLPDGLALPPGAWSPMFGSDPSRHGLVLRWADARTWAQEPFSFRMYVTAVDQAGNESTPSNIVTVAHDGNMTMEREWAELGFKVQSEAGMRAARALNGEWVGTTGDGATVSMVFRLPGFNLSEGTTTIAGTAQGRPRPHDDVVDLSLESHKLGGLVLGISEVQGKMLRICLAKAGAPRPTEFASSADGSVTLYELTRKTSK